MHFKALCVRLGAAAVVGSTLVCTALAAPATVTAQDGLRLRAESNTSSKILATLAKGSTVEVLEAVGDEWYHVSANGQTGYAASAYLSLTEQAAEQTATQLGVVTAATLNVRSGPGTTYDKVATLTSGTQVTILGEENGWYKIDSGYVSCDYVSLDLNAAAARKVGMVSTSSLNVRSGPGTSYSKVATLTAGAEVTILGEENGWYKIDSGYVSADYITLLDASDPSAALQTRIVAYARQFLGYPYVMGSNGPNSFDCSGFVQYVYKNFGYTINRSATQQLKNGVTVAKENLKLGDLVFFNSAGTGASKATHVGIYIGDGQFVHASSPKVGVVISDLYSTYYKKVYTTARRII